MPEDKIISERMGSLGSVPEEGGKVDERDTRWGKEIATSNPSPGTGDPVERHENVDRHSATTTNAYLSGPRTSAVPHTDNSRVAERLEGHNKGKLTHSRSRL